MTMWSYRVVWWSSTALVAVAGVAMAVLLTPLFACFVLFVTLATCAGILSGNLHLLAERPTPPVWGLARQVVFHAFGAGAAGVACYGLGAGAGVGLLGVVGLLAVTSPPVAGRIASWTGRRGLGEETVGSTGVVPSAAELARWTDAELYHVWCSSVDAVVRAAEPVQAVVAVRAREHLLTEFERRHPSGTAAWLSSGAGIEGEPPAFLIDDQEDS